MLRPSKRAHFERLMLPHLDAAYNLARWLTGNTQDAEDVVQEAYLRAFRSFDTYVETNSAGWLLTIVRNTYYTWLRDHRPEHNVVAFDEARHSLEINSVLGIGQSNQTEQDPALASDPDHATLARALRALPPIFGEVIVLRELEELTYKEIASIIDVPVGTVMSRLARARKRLQQVLENHPEVRRRREL